MVKTKILNGLDTETSLVGCVKILFLLSYNFLFMQDFYFNEHRKRNRKHLKYQVGGIQKKQLKPFSCFSM